MQGFLKLKKNSPRGPILGDCHKLNFYNWNTGFFSVKYIGS